MWTRSSIVIIIIDHFLHAESNYINFILVAKYSSNTCELIWGIE